MSHHEDGDLFDRTAENKARDKAKRARLDALAIAIDDLDPFDLNREDAERLSAALYAKVFVPEEADDNDYGDG